RFLWFVSGKPRGRSPPAASASAVRSVDPLALDADGADYAKPCAARRTNPTVWLLNSGLIRTAVDAMRFSTRAQLRGLAKISPPLRRELLQRRQARACLSNTPCRETNLPLAPGAISYADGALERVRDSSWTTTVRHRPVRGTP